MNSIKYFRSVLHVFFWALASSGAIGATVTFSYDSLYRLTNVSYGSGPSTVYSYDAAGNRLTYSSLVTNDNISPSLAIASPTSGPIFYASNNLVNLSGTASDETGITMITWANDRGGIGTASGTASWNISSIPLQPGTNNITVTAYDFSGNSSNATLAVIYSGVVPNYTITLSASPPSGGTVSGGGAFASGSLRTVVATPDPGFAFTDWTENGTVVSASANYTFSLSTNRTLVGNFIGAGSPPPQLTGINVTSNGMFSFSLHGPVGGNYVVLASSNLVDWAPLLTNVIPSGGVRVLDFPVLTNQPEMFYRALPLAQGPLVLQPGPLDSKDIWTTSVYSYAACSSPGPGGGLNDFHLRVGGWADLYYSLIQFDLTGLPTSASSAVVYLYCEYLSGGGTPMYLDQITSFWDWQTQGTGCDRLRLWWADRPSATQFGGSQLPTPTQGQWYAVDITTLYNAWQNGTFPNYGIQFRPVLNANNNFDEFYSGDYLSDPTLRPKLVVTP